MTYNDSRPQPTPFRSLAPRSSPQTTPGTPLNSDSQAIWFDNAGKGLSEGLGTGVRPGGFWDEALPRHPPRSRASQPSDSKALRACSAELLGQPVQMVGAALGGVHLVKVGSAVGQDRPLG